jgi:hypothetical protein
MGLILTICYKKHTDENVQMKYILTTGCSFTNNIRLDPDKPSNHAVIPSNLRSWPYYLHQELKNEYEVLNYGVATNDNVSMCRIMLYHIDRLLKENVDPKNITIIVQWSSAVRQSIYMHKQLDMRSQGLGHTLVYHNNWKNIPGMFYLTGGNDPPTGPGSAVDWLGIENVLKYWQAEVSWNNTLNSTMQWLEMWLLLEKTCKELGIKTYYMSMRDIFTSNSGDNFLFSKYGSPPKFYKWMTLVEVLKPYLDKLPIDSDNYWHHKQYKGLLEWAIDSRNNDIPVFQEFQEFNANTFEEYLVAAGHDWGHPSAEMMEIFVKTELLKLLKL